MAPQARARAGVTAPWSSEWDLHHQAVLQDAILQKITPEAAGLRHFRDDGGGQGNILVRTDPDFRADIGASLALRFNANKLYFF